MACPIKDKTSIKVLNKIKEFISYYGNPEEFGCDNGKEFSNKILKEYMESKNIKLIHGHPYNPKSQGSVERLHQSLKKAIYAFHNEFKYIHIKDIIRIVCQNYNNKRHTTTKFTPNEIFFSDDKVKIKEVINNIKKKFKYRIFKNIFAKNEKNYTFS